MKIKVGVIQKRYATFDYKKRFEIKEGCAVDLRNDEPEKILETEDLDFAREVFNSLVTSISCPSGKTYYVEEYALEIWEKDEDGELEFTGDTESFSKMEIKLITDPGYETYGVYDSLEDAERAKLEYDGEENLFVSFS
jgi:hypothetical protein